MTLYTIHHVQNLPISKETAWLFLSNPSNLAKITPKSMGFVTLAGDERDIFPGQIIHYTIKPLFGISIDWVTEITHVISGSYFVDEQRFGPYAFWHHKHFIEEIAGGVQITDIIHYKLPFGIIGRMFHPLLVKPKLEEIFKHRKAVLVSLFG